MGTSQAKGEQPMSSKDKLAAFRLDLLSEREASMERFRNDALCEVCVHKDLADVAEEAAMARTALEGQDPSEDSCIGALLGLAIGDSLGAPLEFSPVRYGSTQLTEMGQPEIWDTKHVFEHGGVGNQFGFNRFELKPGQWTDDTAMALCLADSLLVNRGFDALDLRLRFCNWWHFGYNNAFAKDSEWRASSSSGSCGLGGNIAGSMREFVETQAEATASGSRFTSGNGSIMRLAPCAIFHRKDMKAALSLADRQSRTTHQGDEAAECARFLAHLLVGVFQARQRKGSPQPGGAALPKAAAKAGCKAGAKAGAKAAAARTVASRTAPAPPKAGRSGGSSVSRNSRSPSPLRASPASHTGKAEDESASPALSSAAAAVSCASSSAELKQWLLGEHCAAFESPLHSVSCLARSRPDEKLTAEAVNAYNQDGEYVVDAERVIVREYKSKWQDDCAIGRSSEDDWQGEIVGELQKGTIVTFSRQDPAFLKLSSPFEGCVPCFVPEDGSPPPFAKKGWQEQRNWNWKSPDFRYSPEREQQDNTYIGSYAMDAISMALHCVWTTQSFTEALLKAANTCGDSDTVAAIAGQVAGAIYGASAIPMAWLSHVEKWDSWSILFRAWLLYNREDEDLLSRVLRQDGFCSCRAARVLADRILGRLEEVRFGGILAEDWHSWIAGLTDDCAANSVLSVPFDLSTEGSTTEVCRRKWLAFCAGLFHELGKATFVKAMEQFMANLQTVLACPLRDYSKLARNLASLRTQKRPKMPIVLLSTGSLCPVHQGHVRNFTFAKEALEKQHPDLVVVGGFLSPTHDGYVQAKYGHNEQSAKAEGWLNSRQRLELVKLAVADSEFVTADAWEVGQSRFVNWPDVAEQFRQELKEKHPECQLLYVCGEDVGGRLAMLPEEESLPLGLCVVTRPGFEGGVKCGKHGKNYVVKGGSSEVSSTKVRQCFREANWEEAKSLLHTQVYLRLRKMGYAENLGKEDSTSPVA